MSGLHRDDVVRGKQGSTEARTNAKTQHTFEDSLARPTTGCLGRSGAEY